MSIDIIAVECLIIGVYSLRLFYSLETLLVIWPQLAKTQSQEFECFEDIIQRLSARRDVGLTQV